MALTQVVSLLRFTNVLLLQISKVEGSFHIALIGNKLPLRMEKLIITGTPA